MTASDILIQRLATVLVHEVLSDPDDLRLFTDWLALYRAELRRQTEESDPS